MGVYMCGGGGRPCECMVSGCFVKDLHKSAAVVISLVSIGIVLGV